MADVQKRKTVGLTGFNFAYYGGTFFIIYTTWIRFATLGAAISPMFGNVST
ncbi:hypothetical protein [Neisseria iguanae]|uniref:hypothetical protein n=1 Tax=Neisseria iguanae TaxID=90242 RepID=UPI0031844FB2